MINTKVFLMNNITSLEEVESNILTLSNEKIVPGLTDTELRTLRNEDKKFFSSWTRLNSIDTSILELDFHNEFKELPGDIKFLVRNAHIEYSKRKKRDSLGCLLSKELRLNIIDIPVIFFENDGNVYAIICTNDKHVRKVIDLIRDTNINLDSDYYNITPNEFYWLFYRYSNELNELHEKVSINNITSFKGNIFDEHHVIEGNSDDTSNLIVTKAFVCTGNDFTKMKIDLGAFGFNIVFLIDNNSNLNIDADSTIFLTEYPSEIVLPLYIIALVVPMIHKFYNEDNFTDDCSIKDEFSKRIGIDVIKKVIEYNQIDIQDLEVLFRETQTTLDVVR